MINSIHMRNCGPFDENGIIFSDCGSVNFIFGANGTGKTTISRFLNNGASSQYSQCSFQETAPEGLGVVVYNSDFRDKAVQSHLPGVFTLGEESGHLKQEINDLNNRLASDTEYLQRLKETKLENEEKLQQERKQLEKVLWETIRNRYKDTLISPIKHVNTKANFVDALLAAGESALTRDAEELCKEVASLYSDDINHIAFPSHSASSIAELGSVLEDIEKQIVWEKVVVGNDKLPVGNLIKALDNGNWVRQGLDYLDDSSTCPFCQQATLTVELKRQIQSYFAGQFEEDIALIGRSLSSYQLAINQFESVHEELIQALGGYPIDLDDLAEAKDDLFELLKNNTAKMVEKEREPNRIIELLPSNKLADRYLKVAEDLKSLVEKRNRQIETIETERNALEDEILSFLRYEAQAIIEAYKSKELNFKSAIQSLNGKIEETEKRARNHEVRISNLRERMSGISSSIEEINATLLAYGYTGFSLRQSPYDDYCYEIVRSNGEAAHETLSEGEQTLISFLYFMQLQNGSMEPSEAGQPKIMVIDDPASSLDAASMFVLTILVRDVARRAAEGSGSVKQLFLLTHNVFFHKEVTQNYMQTYHKKARFWVLRKGKDVSGLQSFHDKNPVDSTYKLLWDELKNASETGFSIGVQNAVRRILEWYFGFLSGGNWKEDLFSKFDGAELQALKSLLHWSDQGSHAVFEDTNVYPTAEEIEMTLSIFKNVFERTDHLSHYYMMMGEEPDSDERAR